MKAKAVRFLVIAMMMAFVQLMVVSTSLAASPNAQQGWGGGDYHTVRYGETLFSIGRMHGVYPYAIAQANGLWNPDYIFAGQVLYIPEGAAWHNNGGCNTDCDTGWDNTGWNNDGCDNGCDNTGWNNDGCDNGCDNTGWNNDDCDNGCDNTDWDNSGCNSGCDNSNWNMQYGNNHPYNYGYGYDNTGYYYNNYNDGQYNQYSYACGYYYNCY